MSEDLVVVSAINLAQGLALREDNVVGSIVWMCDDEGDETDDRDEAAAVVVSWPDGGYSTVATYDYEFSEMSRCQ